MLRSPRAPLAVVLAAWLGCGAPRADDCPATQLSDDRFHSPVPNPPGLGLPHEARYDTSAPGVVTDGVTGLVWQRALDAGRYTRDEAARACDGLALAGGPWRLPTVLELISLVDDTRANPSIDPVAFPDTPGTYFWTATPRAGMPAMGWNVYFGLGDAYYYDLTDTNAVRCVAVSPRAHDGCRVSRGGTITDTDTKLTWQAVVDETARTWDDAVAYCDALALDGGGWRLPRLNELRSLVDAGRASPAIDTSAFPGTPNENFWTASPFARTPGNAWYVYFADGFAGYNLTTSTYRVRCVR